jgi:hypothetical protein
VDITYIAHNKHKIVYSEAQHLLCRNTVFKQVHYLAVKQILIQWDSTSNDVSTEKQGINSWTKLNTEYVNQMYSIYILIYVVPSIL